MDIPQKIRVMRKSEDLTQREFADMIGISYSALTSYEYGRNLPALRSLSSFSSIRDFLNTAIGFCLMKLNPRPGRLYRLSHTLGKTKRNHPAPARRLVNGSPGIYFPEL